MTSINWMIRKWRSYNCIHLRYQSCEGRIVNIVTTDIAAYDHTLGTNILIALLNICVRDNKHINSCCLQRPLCEGLQRLLQNDNTCLQSFSEFYFTNITHVSSNNFIETCAKKKCYWRCQDVSVQSCQVISTRYWALVSAQSHIKATMKKYIEFI